MEPDVRVESQDTLSLGEDRTVLAANTSVEITRAGIFRMSFAMPKGFEVQINQRFGLKSLDRVKDRKRTDNHPPFERQD